MPLGGTNDVQCVEGWNTGAPLRDVHAGIGDEEPSAGRPDRDVEKHPLIHHPALLERESSFEFVAELVQKQRVFQGLAGKSPFGNARHEYKLEGLTRPLLNRPHEDLAVAAIRRFAAQKRQSIQQNLADFIQRDRSDIGHGAEFGQDRQYVSGFAGGLVARDLRGDSATGPKMRSRGIRPETR